MRPLVFFRRGEVEKDMRFLGLLIMKNLVKPESAEVINILKLANLRSVMVTGERSLCTSSFVSLYHEVSVVNFNAVHLMSNLFCLFVLIPKGDNILTAINVAKGCGMVDFNETVIFVNVTPHTAQSVPSLKFSLDEGGANDDHTPVHTRVGPASCF